MLHSKKIYLTFLLIPTGLCSYKYLIAQTRNQKQNESRKATKRPMQNNNPTTNKEASTEITTPSGLRYIITQKAPEGTKKPVLGAKVTVHYTGYLDQNGQPGAKFDSSVDRGTPFQFQIGIGMVIKGWDEGVMGMSVGEKRRLIIPSNLGYGARGAGAAIPPHATLIFDVELLDTK